MSGAAVSGYAVEWLELREGADAAARATELVPLLRPFLSDAPLVIRDLGCGIGSMGRWLAGRLPGRQHWILCDRDSALLAQAVTRPPQAAADGGPVTVEVEAGDVTELRAADLAGTSLVTASALLDLLTADEVAGLAAACAAADCPALLALTVVGRVAFAPVDPLDEELGAAFNDHQRRTVDGGPPHDSAPDGASRPASRRLLGPDAADVAAAAFERAGMTVHRRPSPWQLGPAQGKLTAQWLEGWVEAAVEQRPDLAPSAESYLHRRLAAGAAGALSVVIGHEDLLALPAGDRS
ncbi:class I SAM-dependent methyltransferase [Actinoallomurus purpureus]|uniref:methyltransferase domain-containing protein n=1 Tax=Actinoallomurus purpureus TaxID=478114 RepID=UPI002091FAF1|nr:class I SAM-dependent methyltransferase [Actinoallomurus purpureus]MCO6003611.1 class I SAM-dependent methyltransferase [Actinoallomurus purpureus]